MSYIFRVQWLLLDKKTFVTTYTKSNSWPPLRVREISVYNSPLHYKYTIYTYTFAFGVNAKHNGGRSARVVIAFIKYVIGSGILRQ